MCQFISVGPMYLKSQHIVQFLRIVLFFFVVIFYLGWIWRENRQRLTPTPVSASKMLIDTEQCQLRDWPIFDAQTIPLFINRSGKRIKCNATLEVKVSRVNFTWLHVEFPNHLKCYAREVRRDSNDGVMYGPWLGPLAPLTNFANNLSNEVRRDIVGRWDAVHVLCKLNDKTKTNSGQTFNYVVPLVQHYKPKYSPVRVPSVNVLLLGIDSISRLNFLRHFHQTKQFLDKHQFIPMYGYHKVAENSYPNIMPILSGQPGWKFTRDQDINNFKFDNVPLIFKEFERYGYVTTFMEDMPPYGCFTYGKGGFARQPTDYYLRPVNLAIWDDLTKGYICYKNRIEWEIYYDYLLDLFDSQSVHGNQRHFVLNHLSTLTHDYLNHAGFADAPLYSLLERFFVRGHHRDTLILLYSDHGLRFGDIIYTQSGIYEQRLPLFYLYVPNKLKLGHLNADQLRTTAKSNQHRLTSHYDLHATMLHALRGQIPDDEPYGRSLLAEIPSNRTCQEAGIEEHYCMCHSYIKVSHDKTIEEITQHLIQKVNANLKPVVDLCEEVTFKKTILAMVRQHEKTEPVRHYLLQWITEPGDATFESTIRVEVRDRQVTSITVLGDISRLDRYGDQATCIEGNFKLERFCYCRKFV